MIPAKTARNVTSRSSPGGSPRVPGAAAPGPVRRIRLRAAVLWFTGLPGAGKTTLARALEARLLAAGWHPVSLDGDQLRQGLCGDLGFSAADRDENIRRAAEVARLFLAHGHLVLCSFISPFRAQRDRVRALMPPGRFFLIHVRCSLDTCRRRDPKGLYRRAARGELHDLTGLSSPYEVPVDPDLILDTENATPEDLVDRLWERLLDAGIIVKPEPQPGLT